MRNSHYYHTRIILDVLVIQKFHPISTDLHIISIDFHTMFIIISIDFLHSDHPQLTTAL
jgi:hypothetical protein